MFQVNLFYEQQQLQRERDYDPVRLTIVGGILILLAICLWGMGVYFKMGPLRTRITRNETDLSVLTNNYVKLLKDTGGNPTDFGKIYTQAQVLNDRISHRVFFATQLDVLRDAIPTNCQIKSLKAIRLMNPIEDSIEIPDKDNPGKKKKIPVKKIVPALEMVIEVVTHGKSRLEISEIRDGLVERFHNEPRFREWLRQVKDDASTNIWNDIERKSSNVVEPSGGGMYIGQFEFKMIFASKDQPKDLN